MKDGTQGWTKTDGTQPWLVRWSAGKGWEGIPFAGVPHVIIEKDGTIRHNEIQSSYTGLINA